MQANDQHSTIQCVIHDRLNTANSSEPITVIVSPTTTCLELVDRIKTQFVSISVFVYAVVGSDCVLLNRVPDKSLAEVIPCQESNVFKLFVTSEHQPSLGGSSFSFMKAQPEGTLPIKPYHKCFPASAVFDWSQKVNSPSEEWCGSASDMNTEDSGDDKVSFAQHAESSCVGPDNQAITMTNEKLADSLWCQALTYPAGSDTAAERKVSSQTWLTPICNSHQPEYVGLVNQAMTCYLNSMLQTLYMTPEFRNAIYRWQFPGTEEESVTSIPYQLQRLFLKLQTSKEKSVETVPITRSFGWDSGEAWEQHDIQELCREMFDALERTWQNTAQANLIKELYEGKMEDCIKCLKEEAFTAFCAPEILSGNNQYHCDHCKQLCDVEKRLKFLTFPYLLTVQLMRFSFDPNTMRRIKLNHRVQFGDSLDLDNFISSSSQKNASNTSPENPEPTVIGGNGCTEADQCKESNSYELFSVLVHSGSATGGHYYAYIKSFDEKVWYSFNDTSVHKISWNDVCSTFGRDALGNPWSYSQANAYMLIYRRLDKEKNARPMKVEDFTTHLQEELSKMKQDDDVAMEIREREKTLVSFRLFYVDPSSPSAKPKEGFMRVERTSTLEEATLLAWQYLELEKNKVPLDCVRLVRYDSHHEVIMDSFEGKQNLAISTVFGYLPKSQGNELLLEQKQSHQKFLMYKEKVGGFLIKVTVVDPVAKTIQSTFSMLVDISLMTVGELKSRLAQRLDCDTSTMCCVLSSRNGLERLSEPERNLRVVGFGLTTNKIYVVTHCNELSTVKFEATNVYDVLEQISNTIQLDVHLPKMVENTVSDLRIQFETSSSLTENADDFAGSTGDTDDAYCMSDPYKNNIVVDCVNSSCDKNHSSLRLSLDGRMRRQSFKQWLAKHIKKPLNEFDIFSVLNNGDELPMKKMKESMVKCNLQELKIRLGNPLKDGEYKFIVYHFMPLMKKPMKFLTKTIVERGTTVLQVKQQILKDSCEKPPFGGLTVDRLRLRLKNRHNPGSIYTNDMKFDYCGIVPKQDMELLVEVLTEADTLRTTRLDEFLVYLRLWRPSTYTLEETQEVIVDESAAGLVAKFAQVCGIPEENLEFAKVYGFYPYDTPLLEIDTSLKWISRSNRASSPSSISSASAAVYNDGVAFYCRDSTEQLKHLSAEEQESIRRAERNKLLADISTHRPKEKGLKIHLDTGSRCKGEATKESISSSENDY